MLQVGTVGVCQRSAWTRHLRAASARAERPGLRPTQRRLQSQSRARHLSGGCSAGCRLPLGSCSCEQRLRIIARVEVGNGLAMRKGAAFAVLSHVFLRHPEELVL